MGPERDAINQAFDKFIGVSQTKETDKGIALYDLQSKYGLTDQNGQADNHPYVIREGESKERNFDLAKHAINSLNEDGGIYQSRGDLSGDRAPAKIIGLGISPQFIEKGTIDLRGQVVSSAEDLANLAQVYRDPRFETFRIFYVKGGKIVAHEGITSRLSGLVKLAVTMDERRRTGGCIFHRRGVAYPKRGLGRFLSESASYFSGSEIGMSNLRSLIPLIAS